MEAIAATVRIRDIHHVVIAARGLSDNAARYAQYLFGAHNRLTVTLATPSLITRYQTPPVMTGALVVGISQSGESPDLIAVVEEGRRQGCPTLAVTNVAGSPLTAVADHTIVLRAGKERSIAATKTYTAQLAALAMLSTAMAEQDDWRRELAQVPSFVAVYAVDREIVIAAAAALQHAGHGVVLGRGFNFATAFEAALKAKVLVRGGGALLLGRLPARTHRAHRHGIRRRRHQRCRRGEQRSGGTAPHHRRGGASPVVISNLPSSLALAAAPIPIPDMPEWLSPIAAIVPGQLLAFHLSRLRGFNPDQPRGLKEGDEDHQRLVDSIPAFMRVESSATGS